MLYKMCVFLIDSGSLLIIYKLFYDRFPINLIITKTDSRINSSLLEKNSFPTFMGFLEDTFIWLSNRCWKQNGRILDIYQVYTILSIFYIFIVLREELPFAAETTQAIINMRICSNTITNNLLLFNNQV